MKEINSENVRAQMRKGLLEFATLLIIARGEAYTSDIIEELKKSDLLVVEGTLYPLLSRLRTAGILEHRWEESKSGPPRKYYSVSKKGEQTLQALTESWKPLQTSIQKLIKE